MVTAYGLADSSAAMLRTAQRWRRLQTESWSMWMFLSQAHENQGRVREALAALDSGLAYKPGGFRNAGEKSSLWLRNGMFEEYDQHVAAQLRSGNRDYQASALWAQAISFKMQGRHKEALAAARAFKSLQARGRPLIQEAVQEAVVLMDMGQNRRAAAIWDSIANGDKSPINPSQARHRMWHFTHAATAYAAYGDTTRLRMMEDSVRVNAARTVGWRKDRMVHYVRGLRRAAENRHAEAVVEFRRALYSPYQGLTSVNIGLAKSLLALGRNDEAIDLLRKTRLAPLSAGGLYVNHTHTRELLGTAFERANQRDSALIQYRWVLHAWQQADPEMLPRRRAIESRVAALSRPIPIRP
jgi:tetratricopeptide (TPR) repeat protein